MLNIDPKWLLLAAVITAVATMAAVVTLQVTGHAESVPVVLTFSVGIIGPLLAAIGVTAHAESVKNHEENVKNQEKIAAKVGADVKPTEEKK